MIFRPIEYNEETERNSFICPFCGKEIVLNDEDTFCEHVAFAHERENGQPVYISSAWYDMCCKLLVRYRKSIESFSEYIYENYFDDEFGMSKFREAAEEAVDSYIENGFFNVDILITLLEKSRRKRLLEASVVFECADPCGMSTQYYLADTEVLKSYNK